MQKVKHVISLCILICLLGFASCSTSKFANKRADYDTLSQHGQIAVTLNQDRHSIRSVARIWHDELILLSLQMLGIEMVRIEANKDSIVVFDKMNRRYTSATYAQINPFIHPNISYRTLQDFISGAYPKSAQGESELRLQAGKYTCQLSYKPVKSEKNTLPTASTTDRSRYTYVPLKEILSL